MLKIRGNGIYAYHNVKVDGRVVTVYLGRGPEAVRADARLDRLRARRDLERARVRRELARLDDLRQRHDEICAAFDRAFREAMVARGWRLHKRQWRYHPTMDMNGPAFDEARYAEAARRLFAAASPAELARLIECYGGNINKRFRDRLVKRLATDPKSREAIKRAVDRMRVDLEGDRPSAVEKLVVERCITTYLWLACLDRMAEASLGESGERERHIVRLRASAERSYFSALRSLALVRRAAAVPAAKVVVVERRSASATKGGPGAGRLDHLGAGLN